MIEFIGWCFFFPSFIFLLCKIFPFGRMTNIQLIEQYLTMIIGLLLVIIGRLGNHPNKPKEDSDE